MFDIISNWLLYANHSYYDYKIKCVLVKAWSLIEDPHDNKSFKRLLHTFTGHSRAVTAIVVHPETPTMFISSSLDGTVRLWSFDTMEQLYRYVHFISVNILKLLFYAPSIKL